MNIYARISMNNENMCKCPDIRAVMFNNGQ